MKTKKSIQVLESKLKLLSKLSNMLRVNKILTASLPRLIFRVIGFRSSDVDDSEAISKIKKLESICISFNILPNGFSQDPKVTPSKWTTVKSILYFSLMSVYIFHLALLSVFDLPDEWLLVLGDFFYGKQNRRYFWFLWLNASIVGEILRHYWIYLVENGHFKTLKLYYSIYENGIKSEVLSMNHCYCQKFRFVAINLVNAWLWIVYCIAITFAPILIFIVHSADHKPQTSIQFIYTGFWIFVNYLGIVSTLYNTILPGAIVTVHLSYFYFKAAHIARTAESLAAERGLLNKVDYLLHYKATVSEIIQYQNEIEQLNIKLRNWLIFLYIGLSAAADFGMYIAIFVHIDKFMDLFIVAVASIGVAAIGACSYTNGVILTMMSSYCKNLIRKATRCLQLSARAFIKGTDLQDRLSRTDIAFTIGELLNMTSRVFVIYLIENICLIMMFKVNFK
uniref:Gustatory receptor n=1 Tax=Tetranychus urticae TaxID=32264 RepID=T1K3R6_TETUR